MQHRLSHVTAKNTFLAVLLAAGVAVFILLLLPAFNTHIGETHAKVMQVRLSELKQASEAFVKEHGAITNADNRMIVDLLAGRGGSVQQAPLLNIPAQWLNAKGCVIDAWGTPLVFRLTEDGHALTASSCGPDRKPGGEDDVWVTVQMVPE